MSDRYILLKRDLFERPEHQGYTGIRDQAGAWPAAELPTGTPILKAYDRWSGEHYALPLEAAPEFTQACYDDVARNYLKCQRDDARDRISTLEAEVSRLTALLDEAKTPTHRHQKRGSGYVLIGVGRMQAECWSDDASHMGETVDMREVAIYRSVDDGSLWVRPREEFEDGRFEAIAADKAGE